MLPIASRVDSKSSMGIMVGSLQVLAQAHCGTENVHIIQWENSLVKAVYLIQRINGFLYNLS